MDWNGTKRNRTEYNRIKTIDPSRQKVTIMVNFNIKKKVKFVCDRVVYRIVVYTNVLYGHVV